MAKHEFALMDHVPQAGVRYDQYEGDHLICAVVDDDAIEQHLPEFEILPCYAHTVDIHFEEADKRRCPLYDTAKLSRCRIMLLGH